MNRDDIDSHIALLHMNRKQRLEQEFELLRSQPKNHILRSIVIAALSYVVMTSMFSNSTLFSQPYLLILFVISLCLGAYYECHRVDKRLDTLYKLLQHKEQ